MNFMRISMFLVLSFVLPALAAAQTRLPAGMSPAIQRDVAAIDQHNGEVNKRVGGEKGKVDTGSEGGARFAPQAIAPPRTSIAPGPSDTPERDPFEVSPRLREDSGRTSRFSQQGGMALSQILRLRAVVRGPQGGIAKIQSGKNVIIVRDGDEIDVNNIRYTVTVEADGVLLHGAGAPQYKMLVR
jgi:hypothetical protein